MTEESQNRTNPIKDFFTRKIWSQEIDEKNIFWRVLSNTSKVLVIATRRFFDDRVIRRAADLTYSTLFALVPILALIFAIARGFGFENIVNDLLRNGLIDQDKVDTLMEFIESYLQFAHSDRGMFVGIGLLILLWSVFALANGIEINLNSIWQLKKTRKVSRKITDYFSLLLLIPIAIICLSGLSVLASQILTGTEGYELLGGFLKFLINAMPYLIAGLIFTGFFMFMPNTKVRFKYAILPGILSGIVFQVFQNLYFQGQLKLSGYNAIYGGFAALPLFLLWCNISWTIVLFGCELTYVSQNNDYFNYYTEPGKFSRYHKDYYSLLILNLIARRFADSQMPYNSLQISRELHIPLRITLKSVYNMIDANLIETISTDVQEKEQCYIPAFDINRMTVAVVIDHLNRAGHCDLSLAADSPVCETLKQFEKERANQSGAIWDTPIAEL